MEPTFRIERHLSSILPRIPPEGSNSLLSQAKPFESLYKPFRTAFPLESQPTNQKAGPP
jgi:hypothetical protein